MGIAIILFFWAVVGGVLAGIGALILGCAAAYLTRRVHLGRKKFILAATLFPIVCLGWAGTIFIFQASVNEIVFHRDAGLGDAWTCPLPNGYALLMIDTPDHGWVYNPKTQPKGVVAGQDDAIGGVKKLQVAARYISGSSEDDATQVDSYFLMDTQTGTHITFTTLEALRGKSQELGIQLNLESIDAIYRRYRFTYFDLFAALLLCLPPVGGTTLLIRWLLRLRKTRSAI